MQKHKESAICAILRKKPHFTYRAFFVFLHKINFFGMVPKGLNALGSFVHAAESAS